MLDTMNRLLIRGLRHDRLHDVEKGYELVTRAIRGKWPAPTASPQTLKAERGLGIVGKPYYFYVLRAEDAYGRAVFVVSEAEDAGWPPDARGATPFDSGGWWSKQIKTDPAIDETERQAVFRRLDMPLRGWQDDFEQYIRSRYGTIGDYLKGHAPRSGSEPPGARFTIIKGEPNEKGERNEARAWTWEVRVPHELIAGRLTLRKVYMDQRYRKNYRDWVRRNRQLADSERLRVLAWITGHVEVPKHRESVVRAVRDAIALEVRVD